jgi:hypothetical protein
LFFSFWMVAWYFGESSGASAVIKGLRSGDIPLFDIVWLTLWTFFGVYVTLSVVWRLLGSEVIQVANRRLTLRKQIAGMGRTWEFDTAAINALRYRPGYGSGKRYRESRIELDYGAKTYVLGTGIEPAEASQLLTLISRWVPMVRTEMAVSPQDPPPLQTLGLS